MLDINFDWDSVPDDTHYYDTRSRTPLKQEDNIIWEWTGSHWVRSMDYMSWVPLNGYILQNPECSSLLSK
jgi:hypothetical protein